MLAIPYLDESHKLKVVSYYTVCRFAPLRHVPIVYRSDVTIHEEALFLLTPGVRFKSLLPKIDSTLKQSILKLVDSNFTLAYCSRKFGQAKTHFLSHVGDRKKYG